MWCSPPLWGAAVSHLGIGEENYKKINDLNPERCTIDLHLESSQCDICELPKIWLHIFAEQKWMITNMTSLRTQRCQSFNIIGIFGAEKCHQEPQKVCQLWLKSNKATATCFNFIPRPPPRFCQFSAYSMASPCSLYPLGATQPISLQLPDLSLLLSSSNSLLSTRTCRWCPWTCSKRVGILPG